MSFALTLTAGLCLKVFVALMVLYFVAVFYAIAGIK